MGREREIIVGATTRPHEGSSHTRMRIWLVVIVTIALASAISIWVDATRALAVRPQIAASPASVTPSPINPSPSAIPGVPQGQGQWVVNGATVKLAGAIATEVDAGGNTFKANVRAAKGAWTSRFGITGESPLLLDMSVTGPGPSVDAQVEAFGVPIRIQGTPGQDLNIVFGRSARTSAMVVDDEVLATTAVRSPHAAALSSQAIATRLWSDWLRLVVAFTIVGWVLLLVAGGLREHGSSIKPRLAVKRLGMGALLALDIPLACLLVIAVGLPLGLWWLGLLGLLAFVALAAVGYAYAGYQIGRLILDGVGGGRLSWLLAVPLGVALVVLVGLAPYAGGVLSVLITVYGIGSLLFRPALSAAARPETAIMTRPQEAPSAPGRPIVD